MEQRVDNALSLLGLAKNEKKVFLDLIKNGKSSALEISKRTSIHRTNVYDTLRELITKGLAFEFVENDKKLFISKSPEKLADHAEEIKKEVVSVIPYFKDLHRADSSTESVIMSKGTFALREALNGLLDSNEPISIYGATKDAPESFGVAFLDDFHKRRVEKKILMRHIYHYDAPERILKLNKLKHTEARHLPKKYYSAVSTAICGDTVLLIIFTQPVSLIKIQNKAIAESYNKYFEILWAKSSI
ncbi:hypothetical protein HYZ97_01465 [Candidatus Pacearchaeota archaeon]|nr:hypothetical protein [Candidatus Pacearchaeota archaeon]